MIIKLTTDEVRRLVLIGIIESGLLRGVEGMPRINFVLDDDGSISAECSVGFERVEKDADTADIGGAN